MRCDEMRKGWRMLMMMMKKKKDNDDVEEDAPYIMTVLVTQTGGGARSDKWCDLLLSPPHFRCPSALLGSSVLLFVA